jgi:pimeloyl-ACP methyl ester carboxylesterase
MHDEIRPRGFRRDDVKGFILWFMLTAAIAVVAKVQIASGQPGTTPGAAPADWLDRSPHAQGFLNVNGIRIEYLDWGGKGPPLILLAGLGSTGHIFDDIGPVLTKNFHVIALTRRGFGASDKPEHGYDMTTLVEDIRQAMDALVIDRAIVVGHSLGSREAAALAILYPDRVSKVVYLDGAYNLSPELIKADEEMSAFLPHPSDIDRSSFVNLLAWERVNRTAWNDASEADFRATRVLDEKGYHAESLNAPNAAAEMIDGLRKAPPDFAKVKCPTLAIFADHRLKWWLGRMDDRTRQRAEPVFEKMIALHHRVVADFQVKVKSAKVVVLEDTDHFCFIQREGEVVKEMNEFLGN